MYVDARKILSGALVFATAAAVWGQIAENPEDPTGTAVPYPVVHLISSRDAAQRGATADLRANDPFLLYQTGRDLVNRQFELKHGVYGRTGTLNVPLFVEPTQSLLHGGARFARDHAASCGMCHSSVYSEPSSGQTIASTGGFGRNTTHFYGAGLIEMLAAQVRAMVMNQYDLNHNDVIDRAEITASMPVRIQPAPDGPTIDYGDLAPGPDGVPRLNPVFRVWYLDSEGHVLKDATAVGDPRVAAFDFAMQPFGWGRGYRRVGERMVSQGGESTTTREFYTVAADIHMGMQAHDPTQQRPDELDGYGGKAQVSLNGAQQFDFGGSPDPGHKRTPKGVSLDDPDRDGVVSELTEGDVDAVEFYLLHVPPPAVRPSGRSEEGRAVLVETGCTRCHVESWRIEARDDKRGFTGDRRLFHLETRVRQTPEGATEIVGTLQRLWKKSPSGAVAPAYGAFPVERVYSDFKHWDIGPAFHERRFDGSLQREHRTAPLWGVGSSGPYGHGGNFISLDTVISAHAGAAAAEAAAYRALSEEKRELLLSYLRSLVLYPTTEIPVDVDGDGKIDDSFKVAGQDVGYERFDARFLFRRAPRYQLVTTVTAPNGRPRLLQLITNIPEAFGLDRPYRIDRDRDGFPDVLGPVPRGAGAENAPSSR